MSAAVFLRAASPMSVAPLTPINCGLPRITFSTLAKAMGPTTLARLARLVEGHKVAAEGPRRSYQTARKQAIQWLVDGIGLDPHAGLRSHEREAVAALSKISVDLPPEIYAERPPNGQLWVLGGVCISMLPDVLLDGPRGRGAIKFSFTKERLGRGVGSMMAALMWHWLANVQHIEKARPDLCRVYEPRLPWLYQPGRNPEKQVAHAEKACRLISAIWSEV